MTKDEAPISDRKSVRHEIGSGGLDALSLLLTRGSLRSIHTSSIRVEVNDGCQVLLVPHVSISAGGRWVIITNDWGDTETEFLDYHLLDAHQSDAPKDVPLVPWRNEYVIGQPSSSIQYLDGSWDRLEFIRILEYSERGEEDSVQYDSAIVFGNSAGKRFALTPQRSISGLIEVRVSDDDVDDLEKRFRLRVEFRRPGRT